MPFEIDMKVVTLHSRDGVVRQKHVVRGQRLLLIQERRDDGDQVMAYEATDARDAQERRVFRESVPLRRSSAA